MWGCLEKWKDEPNCAETAAKSLIQLAMKYWRNESPGYRDDICVTVVVLPLFEELATTTV